MNKTIKILSIVIGVAFFLLYSFLIFNNQNLRFSWPDEMANNFFINQFENKNNFSAPNLIYDSEVNIISPRSITIYNSNLVPVGFIGLPLIWGVLAKIVGSYFVLFLTPLLAVIGVYFFYKLVSMLFNERIGLLSGIMLLTFAPYIYYSSFVLLPNIAFISFLIMSLYFLARILLEKNSLIFYLLSSIFLSLSLLIRPSELFWVVFLYLSIYVINYKKFNVKYIATSLLPMIGVLAMQLYSNLLTYGSMFTFGYLNSSNNNTLGAQKSLIEKIFTIIFPFGIKVKTILSNFNLYIFQVNWLFVILAIFGVVSFVYFLKARIKKHYLIFLTIIFLYLLVYYGSWQLSDNFILTNSKLGVSYNRYLLPVLIAFIPLIAFFVDTLLKSGATFKKWFGYSVVVLYVIINIFTAYFYGNDSLIKVKQSINQYNELHEIILDKTQDNSIIITKRGDKIVFPQRNVISQFSDKDVASFSDLLKMQKLYYLIYKDEKKIFNLNEGVFANNNLQIVNPDYLKYDYILYEIKKK